MIITQDGKPRAVLQDIESYENLHNSLNMLKLIVTAEKNIDLNKTIPQEVMFDKLEKKLFN